LKRSQLMPKLSEIFKKDAQVRVIKLEISDSKIDPELFKRVPLDLEELSLNSVRDLEDNVLCIRPFLTDPAYHDLKSLTLENQLIDDSDVSLMTHLQALKRLNLSYNQINDQGFSEITTMQWWKIEISARIKWGTLLQRILLKCLK